MLVKFENAYHYKSSCTHEHNSNSIQMIIFHILYIYLKYIFNLHFIFYKMCMRHKRRKSPLSMSSP